MNEYLRLLNRCIEFYCLNSESYNHYHDKKFRYDSGDKFCRYSAIWSQDPGGVIGTKTSCGYPVRHEWDIKHYLGFVGKDPVVIGKRTITNMLNAKIKLPGTVVPYAGNDVNYSYTVGLFHMPYRNSVVFAGGAAVIRDMLPYIDELTVTVLNDNLPESDDYVRIGVLDDILSVNHHNGLIPGDFAITNIKLGVSGFIADLKRAGYPNLRRWSPQDKAES